MATYAEIIQKVRTYLDRDSGVLSDTQLNDFLNYAADKAYRTLRVPAHEVVMDFTVADGDFVTDKSTSFGSEVNMPVPNDLIELIYIQKKGTGVVWNQKVDARTFHDRFADKKDSNYYTRIGSNFILHGTLATGDVLEVCYYQRGNAVDAKYDISPANYLVQATKGITTMTALQIAGNAPAAQEGSLYFNGSGLTLAILNGTSGTRPVSVSATSSGNNTTQVWFSKAYQPNWLRDQNERIILYGALAEAFTYLEEPNQTQVYEGKFLKEISELNAEETNRIATGGNTSVSFSGMGLI